MPFPIKKRSAKKATKPGALGKKKAPPFMKKAAKPMDAAGRIDAFEEKFGAEEI